MPPRTIQDQAINPPFTQSIPSHNLDDSDEENQQLATPTVPAANAQRPSAGWLRNPAWIDGGVNPPKFYHSREEINDALRAAGVSPATLFDQHSARISPTPAIPAPPAPLTLDLVNSMDLAGANTMNIAAPPSAHVVNVSLIYPAATTQTSGRGKAAPKKARITKMDNIILTSISRVDFIKAGLATHSLDQIYSPGVNAGPDFKLWWNGIPGGKAGAPSIQNNHQFEIALQALLKKNKASTIVNVEFDTDTMEGFRIKQTVPPGIEQGNSNNEDELVYGTRVPQVENFSSLSQLHGQFILELKKKWPCQMHQGEHGEVGYCYVAPSGGHTRLNTLRFKTWAAAMAAGDATKHEPPQSTAFDGARDGRLSASGSKARGRTGPHSRNAGLDDHTNDTVSALLSAFLPLIGGNFSRKRGHDDHDSPISTPKRVKTSVVTTSPLPEAGTEIHVCLRDFAEHEGIDMTSFETPLRKEDFTPDIIPLVDDAELRKITGATAGAIIKLKKFCKEWHTRQESKIRSQKH